MINQSQVVVPIRQDRLAEPELSILMPCLNEARTLGACISKAQNFLKKNGVSGEVIVADNGSTDGSVEIAQNLNARVVNVPIRGYGAALAAGIEAARGKYVIMGDSDRELRFLGAFAFRRKTSRGLRLGDGKSFSRWDRRRAPCRQCIATSAILF